MLSIFCELVSIPCGLGAEYFKDDIYLFSKFTFPITTEH